MDETLPPGLYEALLTTALQRRLTAGGEKLEIDLSELPPAEVPNRVALHLGAVIERALEQLPEKDRAAAGARVARELLTRIDDLVDRADSSPDAPITPSSILHAVLERDPSGAPRAIERPLISLLDTTLLTNAPGEPRVGRQVLAEIASSDRIDLLMAFIRRSGLGPMRESLARHCADGRPLRVLTTTYTGSTERSALDLLRDLGAEVRVSYDTSTTRLHAKSWIFHRRSGHTTAYIGSSNLTRAAQVTGLEWNVRVSRARNPDVIDKVRAVFESYWESDDFRDYDPGEFEENTARARDPGPRIFLSPVELRPEPFQERLLERLTVSRRHGHHRNLLAAATGTGKTVMAALDYARLRETLPRDRLLFVAHRQEILDQSQATFRHVLRDAAFGEQWIGGKRPRDYDHVFASIQSLARMDRADLAPDHFDVVIVDEFHHAAAPSYERLLQHVEPRELLGLTATPERADGLPVLQWFGGRIAAELRLWDAIDEHRLVPFSYFGIHDGLDLKEVPWRRGAGYDVDGLTKVYTASDAWARAVIKETRDRVADLGGMRALGFCVSVAHARYMARVFQEAGLSAVAVWGDSPEAERAKALSDLAAGRIQVVFSVDLFNEGVDVPSVDTLLMLRPTDSPTLFLQQLGRGLRRAKGKAMCLVLDFVGHHRREFRFDRRLRALLGGTRKDVERQVRGRFPYLPAGCHMELDRVASEIVLRSIRSSVPSNWTQKVEELRALVESGRQAAIPTYLEHSGLDLEDLYAGTRCWSDLCESAGAPTRAAGPEEATLRRAIGRLLHVDDDVRLRGYHQFLSAKNAPGERTMTERDRRVARMLVAQLTVRAVEKTASLQDGIDLLWRHPQVLAELRELFSVLEDGVDHAHAPVTRRPELPLMVHARYTRIEILAAFGSGAGAKVAPWQTGVTEIKGERADAFAFTLDKTEGSFSPTTRYRDYALSPELIHWQSQSVTRAESATGRRYVEHVSMGHEIFLFARLRQSDRAFWFLGPATYVRHEGERPMSITWRLEHRLPGDLFIAFAAAV